MRHAHTMGVFISLQVLVRLSKYMTCLNHVSSCFPLRFGEVVEVYDMLEQCEFLLLSTFWRGCRSTQHAQTMSFRFSPSFGEVVKVHDMLKPCEFPFLSKFWRGCQST